MKSEYREREEVGFSRILCRIPTEPKLYPELSQNRLEALRRSRMVCTSLPDHHLPRNEPSQKEENREQEVRFHRILRENRFQRFFKRATRNLQCSWFPARIKTVALNNNVYCTARNNRLNKVDRCLARYSPRAEANNAIPCNTVRYNTIPCNTIRYNAMTC